MDERGREFADLAYTVLVTEKRRSVEDVAVDIGMTYAALHARLINRTCFSADEIRALIRAVPDARFGGYLLEGTHFVAADRVDPDDDPSEDADHSHVPGAVQRGATRVVVEATSILETVDAALAGGGLRHREGLIILREIEEAERALASLRLRIAEVG